MVVRRHRIASGNMFTVMTVAMEIAQLPISVEKVYTIVIIAS